MWDVETSLLIGKYHNLGKNLVSENKLGIHRASGPVGNDQKDKSR